MGFMNFVLYCFCLSILTCLGAVLLLFLGCVYLMLWIYVIIIIMPRSGLQEFGIVTHFVNLSFVMPLRITTLILTNSTLVCLKIRFVFVLMHIL